MTIWTIFWPFGPFFLCIAFWPILHTLHPGWVTPLHLWPQFIILCHLSLSSPWMTWPMEINNNLRYFSWKWPLFHFWSLSPLKRGVVCGIQNGINSIFTTIEGHYYANVTWLWNFQGWKKFFLIFAGSNVQGQMVKNGQNVQKFNFQAKGGKMGW